MKPLKTGSKVWGQTAYCEGQCHHLERGEDACNRPMIQLLAAPGGTGVQTPAVRFQPSRRYSPQRGSVRILILPLVILGALASYLAGLGAAARWHTPFPLEYLISSALNAAWLLPAVQRCRPSLTAICWIASVWLTRQGIAALYLSESELLLAILLEGICLLLAFSVAPKEPWADRLARWRRARAEIATQLHMAQGILPWTRRSFRQFTGGAADTPLGSDYYRFAAALADAEHRLRVRLNRATMPEQLRQSILNNVSAIVAQADTSAAQRAIELERQALAAAATCREQCERLENLPPSERKVLAGQCEQVFLELARVEVSP